MPDDTTPCRTCRWWLFPSTQNVQDEKIRAERGECHRMPPALFSFGQIAGNLWPMTKPDDWCGEWQKVSIKRMKAYKPSPTIVD